MAQFIAEHNLSMSVADELPSLIKKMCPDSAIAKDLRCARSKTTAIINEMAVMTQESLIERMRNSVFTISTDGSNDVGSSKLFPFVVRTVTEEGIHSELVSVPHCDGSATGEAIFSLMDSFFTTNNIPWTNCIAIGCDNANVMAGEKGGVYGLCLKKNPNVTFAGCPLHLIHIAAQKGAQALPVSAHELLTDIHYYLNKSSLREHRLKQFQALYGCDQLKMLKHGSTRWLSTGRCLERLLENWDPLKDFFKTEALRTDLSPYAMSKVQKVKEAMQSRSSRLYFMFLRYAIKPMESFLTFNQSNAPQASTMINDCKRLIRTMMTKFVAATAFGGNKQIEDIEYWLSYNQKDDKNLLIGEECQAFIDNKTKNGLSDSKLKTFYSDIKNFYKGVVEYLLKKLPLKDQVLTKLSVSDPKLLSSSSLSDIRFFAQKFPILIPQGISIDTLIEEFTSLQCASESVITEENCLRVDEFWLKVGNIIEDGNPLYRSISKFMLGLLTIPHSSAHCERVFSCVRKIQTDQRSSLGHQLLESLLIVKHKKKTSFNADTLACGHLKRLKGAYTASLGSS